VEQNEERVMIAAAMGWIGTLGTISAYVMLSRGYLHAGSVRYAVLNFVGGLLGAAGSAVYGAWPSVASNLIWSGVALQSILLTLHQRRSVRHQVVRQLPDHAGVEPATAVPHYEAQRMSLSAA
jgi:amino acid transporter